MVDEWTAVIVMTIRDSRHDLFIYWYKTILNYWFTFESFEVFSCLDVERFSFFGVYCQIQFTNCHRMGEIQRFNVKASVST